MLFEFQTASKRNRHTHTAAAYRLPGRNLSEFVLQPEGRFGFIVKLIGTKDIDFSASPGFSGNYLLTGRDESKVRTLFDQELLELVGRETGWTVEGHGEWLMIYRRGTREKPDRLSQFLVESGRVADALARPRLHDAPEQAPADDDAMRPEPEEPSEGVKQALSESFQGRFVSRYRRPFFLASITVMTFGLGMRVSYRKA